MNLVFPAKLSNLAYLFIFVVVYVATFHISGLDGATPESLDSSWQVVIEYAFVTGLRFGRDIVFTYGPLGFLGSDVSQGLLVTFRSIFAFVWTGVVAFTVLGAARFMPLGVRWFFIAWVVVFSAYSGMEYYLYPVLAYGVLQLLFAEKHRNLVVAAVLGCFAFLALIKFTMLLAVATAVLLCTLVKIGEQQWRNAVILPGGFLLLFVTGWCAVGQEFSLLVPWLRSSMEIAAGYTAAMSSSGASQSLYLVIAAIVAFSVAFCLALKAAMPVLSRLGMMSCLLMFAFFEWKHGIVRPDSRHLSWFFVPFPLLCCFLWTAPLQAFSTVGSRRVAAASLFAASLVCFTGMVFHNEGLYRETIIGWPATIQAKLFCMGNLLSGRSDLVYAAQKDVSRNWAPDLAEIRAIAGSERIDVMSCRQWVAIANGLNYSPRPIIQGYKAYTPYLIDQNRRYLSGAGAPAYVILAMETIDDRFPTLDDPGAMEALLQNYQPVADDNSYVLLRRQKAAPLRIEPVLKRSLRFGESLDLTAWGGRVLFMSVEMKPTAAVKLRRLFYREPLITIRVQSGGKVIPFRFIPAMATDPFIISPLLVASSDVEALYSGQWQSQVATVQFEETDTAFGRFADSFTVTLYTSQGF